MPLSIRDKEQLARWLASRATLAEVESVSSVGLVGNVRFSERARDAYSFLWRWSAQRFAGTAGAAQDRFYALHGADALTRRIARVRRVAVRLGMPGDAF
jgi:hypothetical protein